MSDFLDCCKGLRAERDDARLEADRLRAELARLARERDGATSELARLKAEREEFARVTAASVTPLRPCQDRAAVRDRLEKIARIIEHHDRPRLSRVALIVGELIAATR